MALRLRLSCWDCFPQTFLRFFADLPPPHVVNTVGAGDSFPGAMILRLSQGEDVAEALRYAVAAGAVALLAPGTELAQPADTDQLLARVDVERAR